MRRRRDEPARPPASALGPALAFAAAALLAACASPSAPPEPYAEGDRLAPFELEDAHGTTHRVGPSLRTLLFARDMDSQDVAHAVLAEASPALLRERETAYVADISGMPGVITRLFALPEMRERSYTMLLDREGELTERLPFEAGRVTLLRLGPDLRILRVRHLGEAAALREALDVPPPDEGAAPSAEPGEAAGGET